MRLLWAWVRKRSQTRSRKTVNPASLAHLFIFLLSSPTCNRITSVLIAAKVAVVVVTYSITLCVDRCINPPAWSCASARLTFGGPKVTIVTRVISTKNAYLSGGGAPAHIPIAVEAVHALVFALLKLSRSHGGQHQQREHRDNGCLHCLFSLSVNTATFPSGATGCITPRRTPMNAGLKEDPVKTLSGI